MDDKSATQIPLFQIGLIRRTIQTGGIEPRRPKKDPHICTSGLSKISLLSAQHRFNLAVHRIVCIAFGFTRCLSYRKRKLFPMRNKKGNPKIALR